MRAAWIRLLGDPRFPVELGWIGEIPLIGSQALIDRIDDRLRTLVAWLAPRLRRQDDPVWPHAPAADVLTADLAIVAAPETEAGWDLRWVEIQTFTSLVSTIYTLHHAAAEVWPELAALAFWGPEERDWLAAAQTWMAPAADSILLESAPWSQPTRTDFEAAAHWFGLAVTDPQELRARGAVLERRGEDGHWHAVPHVANRVILHEAPARAELQRLLARVTPTWNSHPAWYYRIDKAVMPELPLPPAERCARGRHWRELGLPPETLVAKAAHSHSGRAVRLALDRDALDALDANWIVQPRFAPMPLVTARDGVALYGEIRCVMALHAGRDPWLACRLVRLNRAPVTSTSAWSGAPGEGAVPLYEPPA
jgi:hypothetical protein